MLWFSSVEMVHGHVSLSSSGAAAFRACRPHSLCSGAPTATARFGSARRHRPRAGRIRSRITLVMKTVVQTMFQDICLARSSFHPDNGSA